MTARGALKIVLGISLIGAAFSGTLTPNSIPSFVVVLIWQFTSAWNDFLFAVFFSSSQNGPVTLALNNLANGPICLLTRRTIRDTFSDPVVKAAAVRAVEEGLAIAAAMGRPVATTAEERIARSIDIPHKPSILQDLEMGRPMEIDALFTVPLRLARQAGVPTPTLSLMVAMAVQAAEAAGLYRRAAAG